MSISRRNALKCLAGTGAATVLPWGVRARAASRTEVSIASGSRAIIYYLPLAIADIKGFFKEEDLSVSIANFAGGSAAVKAVVGGSSDVISGAFEHAINLQSKGQFYRAFVQQGQAPMIALGISTKTMANYKSPADLKGKKIGVTAPGSSTAMVVSFFLSKHGIQPNEVSFIGVGGGPAAVTAIKSGQVDAISNLDPIITTLVASGDLKVIADTRTVSDTQKIFGGNMPSGSLMVSQEYIDANPDTVQRLANAIVRANKWIQRAGADEVLKTVPDSFYSADPNLYKACVRNNMEALSPDGLIATDGPVTALHALAAYVPDFDQSKIDLSKCWTNSFAEVANKKRPNG